MIPEKLETCPRCNRSTAWRYDGQSCGLCGFDRLAATGGDAHAALRLALPILVEDLQGLFEGCWIMGADGPKHTPPHLRDPAAEGVARRYIEAIRAGEAVVGQVETRALWLRRIIDAGGIP